MSDAPLLTPDLTRQALAALLDQHGLGELQSVNQLRGDEDGALLEVNGQLVVKLARSDAEQRALLMEALLFRRLHHATEMPCPEVLAHDTARATVPFDALILRQPEGIGGDMVWPRLDLPTREHISEELGRLCASVHGLHWPVYGAIFTTGPIDTRSARWADIVNGKIVHMYHLAEQRALLPLQLLDDLVTTLNDGDAVFDRPSAPTLTHTDLGLGNVVLRQNNEQWHVAAILGWEQSLVADAAWEFATLWRDPAAAFPLADSLMQGYKERRPLQEDLRVRQRLYRLMRLFEQLIVMSDEPDPAEERKHSLLTTLVRLLKPR